MEDYISRNVICFDHFRTAAVHFNRVIPFDTSVVIEAIFGTEWSDKNLEKYKSTQELQELMQTISNDSKVFWEMVFGSSKKLAFEFHLDWEDSINEFSRVILRDSWRDELEEYDKSRIIKSLQGQTEETKESYQHFLHVLGIPSASLFLSDSTEFLYDSSNTNIMATIAGIPLVNAEQASLLQIRQLREDTNAQRKLRNLRLFLFQNYTGKPKSFIEDDIHKRMDEYYAAASKHGFDIFESSLTCLIDAKSIQATIAGGLIGWLLGGPVVGITSGLTVEIASLSLTLARGIRELRLFRKQHDLAYIFHAKKSIEK